MTHDIGDNDGMDTKNTPFINAKLASEKLGLPRKLLLQLVEDRRIPSIKDGKSTFINIEQATEALKRIANEET